MGKTLFFFILISGFLALAQAQDSVFRKPDAQRMPASQGELMLQTVKDVHPDFMVTKPGKTVYAGYCRTSNGVYYFSYENPSGYADCLDDRFGRSNWNSGGAGVLFLPR
jgi:hypothetical protein